jgi:hypothetical protein
MWTLLLVSALGITLPGADVQTLDGHSLAGPIIALTTAQIVVQSAKGQETLETSQVAGLTIAAPTTTPARRKAWVELVDGCCLPADDYTVEGGRATITLAGGEQSLPLATTEIAAVRFSPPSAAVTAEWTRIRERAADSDRLIVHKGDTIDDHQGILRDVTAAVVRFEVDGEVLPVKRERVSGLIYYHSARAKLPEAACHITDIDGGHWAVQAMSLADGKLRWSTPTGLTISRPLGELQRIDFSGGRMVYLSDIQPESVAWSPYFRPDSELPVLNQFYAPRQDRTMEMLPLKLGGKQYRKGLALHGRTEMTYRLPDRFRRFQAVVGIDDRVRPQGAMRLVVRGDHRVLWEAVLTGTDAPLPLDLDVGGVRRLSIVADFSETFDVGDQLLLCEAKVIK